MAVPGRNAAMAIVRDARRTRVTDRIDDVIDGVLDRVRGVAARD
jgi:hypothetical protein